MIVLKIKMILEFKELNLKKEMFLNLNFVNI